MPADVIDITPTEVLTPDDEDGRVSNAELQKELAWRELCRRKYSAYLSYTHRPLWTKTRMSQYLADEVQKFIDEDTGHAYDILVIATPPQHGKSMTVSESLPAWYLTYHPDKRVILASYNEDTAQRFCRRNADKVRTFSKTLNGVEMGGIDRSTEFELSNGRGRMISRGVMSGITGNPADLIIIDDPIKNREEADSPTFRDKLWQEWQNSIKSRLAAGAKVLLIMTPWHDDDMRARLLASEPHIRQIRLPVEAEENDPLGRQPGEPLCPELGKGVEWLAQFKASYLNDPLGGVRAWQALYMCSPRIEEGNLVKRDWWRTYDPSVVNTFGTELISVDATFKKTDTSDYVAITVWGKLNNDYYCRYCLNKRMSFSETITALKMVKQLFPQASRVLIEDKANGSAIIDSLGREMFCIPITPRGGKESRVNAIAPAIESGHVYLPQAAPWLHDFIEQFSAFPNGVHDDMVDSASQALTYMIYASGSVVDPTPTEEEIDERVGRESFTDADALFDVYSNTGSSRWEEAIERWL